MYVAGVSTSYSVPLDPAPAIILLDSLERRCGAASRAARMFRAHLDRQTGLPRGLASPQLQRRRRRRAPRLF